MLACNQLGNNGRLGNQMFQYAALKGIARRRGFEYCIPPFGKESIDNYGLGEAFDIKANFGTPNLQQLGEPHFHYSKEMHDQCPDNVSLVGYYQTEKYFKDIEDEIRRDFTFKKDIVDTCKEVMKPFNGKQVIFLHVRRGDPNLVDKRGFKWAYVNCSDQHPVQAPEYYEEALLQFPTDFPVMVFSDSIDWCKEQRIFKSPRFSFSEPLSKYPDGALVPHIDLCLMTMCDHAIIANSSMSWWGAWLIQNSNKHIVAPRRWFGPAYAHHDTKDIYCKGWKIV